MIYLFSSLLISFLVALIICRAGRSDGAVGLDLDCDGVQKFHAAPVPRIGGVAVFAGFAAAMGFAVYRQATSDGGLIGALLICSLPAFLSGLLEDVTRKVGPGARLMFTALAAAIAFFVMDAGVRRVDSAPIDWLLGFAVVSFVVTVVCVAAISNAVNIIDGFNGLAGAVAVIMFGSLAYVAFKVGDRQVFVVAVSMAGALAGFLLWNYPFGKLFLGDGGAYFVGFVLGVLAILVVSRNPTVSAWYAAALLVYPIFEVAFSMYRRRRRRRRRPATQPDAIHLHSLIYRRIVGPHSASDLANVKVLRNSMTSPYLWVLASLSVVPATIWWDKGTVLIGVCVVFCIGYVLIYRSIVHFSTPFWLDWR